MEDVEGLVRRVRDAGLPVRFEIDGDRKAVPTALAVCFYRIVQEALSNVVRHSGAVPTEVSVDISSASVRLRIDNDPPRSPTVVSPGSGAGLAGLRERVAVFRGSLQAGPREDTGSRSAPALSGGCPDQVGRTWTLVRLGRPRHTEPMSTSPQPAIPRIAKQHGDLETPEND